MDPFVSGDGILSGSAGFTGSRRRRDVPRAVPGRGRGILTDPPAGKLAGASICRKVIRIPPSREKAVPAGGGWYNPDWFWQFPEDLRRMGADFFLRTAAVMAAFIFPFLACSAPDTDTEPQACGGTHQERDAGAPREIISRNIVSFELTLYDPREMSRQLLPGGGDPPRREDILARFMKLVKNPDGTVTVEARGGSLYPTARRNGLTFHVRFTAPDRDYTARLQDLVVRRSLIRNNGLVVHTYGLPSGDGDRLSVKYDSGEYIYRRINTGPLLDYDTAFEIYDLFRTMTRDQGLDFNTKGSNVQLYDDATEEFLQGTWKGTHFGNECTVIFTGNHVRIYYGGKLTDDADYVIDEGWIVPADQNGGKDRLRFQGVAVMSKKNSFTLSGTVLRNKASSTFDLRRQKEQSPAPDSADAAGGR